MDRNPMHVDPSPVDERPRSRFPFLRTFDKNQIIADSKREYTPTTLIGLFLFLSMLAWSWEAVLYLIDSRVIVNPGVLHGPWLPIYGSGGILMLLLLKRWRARPIATFFMAIAICAIVENTTGLVLEALTGATWWDYSGYALGIGKYLCVEGLLAFGLAGLFLIYILAPAFATAFKKLSPRTKTILLVVLLSLFILDASFSVVWPNYMASNQNPLIGNFN